MSRKELECGDRHRTEDQAISNWNYQQNMFSQWIENIQVCLPESYKAYGRWPTALARGFKYSYEGRNETWRPFLLSRGKATIYNQRAIESVQHE